MASSSAEQSYLDDLRSEASGDTDLCAIYGGPSNSGKRQVLIRDDTDVQKRDISARDLLALVGASNGETVCVCQHITFDYIAVLGAAWGLEKGFFLHHAKTPDMDPFDRIFSDAVASVPTGAHVKPYACIEGFVDMIELLWERSGRPIFPDFANVSTAGRRPSIGATRITYYRVSDALYLILIDAPTMWLEPDGIKAEQLEYGPTPCALKTRYGRHNRRLVIPQFLADLEIFSASHILETFLTSDYSPAVLFGYEHDKPQVPVPPHVLAQFLAISVWRDNLDWFAIDLRDVSFNRIQSPNRDTVTKLHRLRKYLSVLIFDVATIRTMAGPDVAPRDSLERDLLSTLNALGEKIEKDAAVLERFLMDTFQLLMSTLSIRASESSIEDARRGIVLTQLATIYVPLSFVTGIWGMNVREINDSKRPLWMFAVTLVVALAATAAVLLLLRHWKKLFADARNFWTRPRTKTPARPADTFEL